jgi:hypothetical protein
MSRLHRLDANNMHVSSTIFPRALLANATIGFLNWELIGSDAAVMSGSFNRSVFEAPHEGYASDPSVQQAYDAFSNAHTARIPSGTTIMLHKC